MSFNPNFRKKRSLFAALALGLVLTMAAVTLWGGRAISAGGDYSELKVFTEVLQTVKSAYVKQTDTKDLVYAAIKGMVGSLDPHSGFMTPDEYKEMQVDTSGQFGGLGMEVGVKDGTLVVISPIEGTPAYKAGIKPGDRIVKIDGQPTGNMTLMDAVKKMRGPKGTSVTLSVWREGMKAPRDFAIVRDIIKVKSVKWKVLDEKAGVGYIKLTQFQEKSAAQLADAIGQLDKHGMRSLVLDLRNNPGGLLNSAVDIASQFLPKGKLVVSIKGRSGPSTDFNVTDTYPRHEHLPMVVLINQGSASAAEIVAGALKDWHRAVIMGTRSFGKGSVQTVIPFEDGSALRLTTAMYYTPSGVSIQDTGITPDIEVTLALVKGEKEYPYIREKDLKNHFYFEGSKHQLEIQGNTETKEKMAPLLPGNEKNDNQLQRAVDLLKSLSVFEKVSKAA
ncbi:MAG: S41 family peptidase [Nitrospiraceae bacterium]|nr:S41 family peptidase [Nitrospiraceae bacterium]